MDFLKYLCQTCQIKSWGSSWEYFRQYKQLYASVARAAIWTETTVEKFTRCVSKLPPTDIEANAPRKWHDATLVDRYRLQVPGTRGKDVANSDALLVLLTFNIKYDTSIFPGRHRVQLLGCYQCLAYTATRPAGFVDGERKSGKDGCFEELFSQHAPGRASSDDDDKERDEHSNCRNISAICKRETGGKRARQGRASYVMDLGGYKPPRSGSLPLSLLQNIV